VAVVALVDVICVVVSLVQFTSGRTPSDIFHDQDLSELRD